MNQQEKYQSDYFDYLCAPESAVRYQMVLQQVRQQLFSRPIRLFDLGCGNGALAPYIDDDILYYGFDHNPAAIASARSKSWTSNIPPQFEVSNIIQWSNQPTYDREKKADVLVFSGLLGGVLHGVDQFTILDPCSEQNLVSSCIRNHLKHHGLISVVTPFSYEMHKPSTLFSYAAQRRKILDQRLLLAQLSPLTETIIPMPRVHDAVKRQVNKPRWYEESLTRPDQLRMSMGVWCSLFACISNHF